MMELMFDEPCQNGFCLSRRVLIDNFFFFLDQDILRTSHSEGCQMS